VDVPLHRSTGENLFPQYTPKSNLKNGCIASQGSDNTQGFYRQVLSGESETEDQPQRHGGDHSHADPGQPVIIRSEPRPIRVIISAIMKRVTWFSNPV
jgi:hypothetical protein